ncbi:Uncharacterised protein [Enterobacter cloacae]|nr:Uncharacterised protein [Enterobacter cloacae]
MEVIGWPLVIRDARIIPAAADTSPESTKIMILVRTTGTPARRAASSLPPIASVLRPNVVRLSRKPNRIKQPTVSQIGAGSPSQLA